MLSLLLAVACSMPVAVQDDSCDGSCHKKDTSCSQTIRICGNCGRNRTVCGAHATFCTSCAESKKICPYCGKSKIDPAVKVRREKLDEAIPKAIEGHRLGRRIPMGDLANALEGVEFYYVFHSALPCPECEPKAEPVAAYESKEKKATILRSEEALSELLTRNKLGGESEQERSQAVLLAGRLVQLLWDAEKDGLRAVRGGKAVDPEDVVLVEAGEEGGWTAEFRFVKGETPWHLTIRLDKDGRFTGLETRKAE